MTQTTSQVAPVAIVAEEARSLMARRRGTQTELARRTGKRQTYWSRRLLGEVPFGVDDLADLAAYLEVPVVTLVAPLDTVSGGRPPIGRYGDTPGHDTPKPAVDVDEWELAA